MITDHALGWVSQQLLSKGLVGGWSRFDGHGRGVRFKVDHAPPDRLAYLVEKFTKSENIAFTRTVGVVGN